MRFAHVYQTYEMVGDDARRHEVAKKSWERLLWPHVQVCPFDAAKTDRTADKLVGDARNVPYVNDMIEAGFADPTIDAVILTNSDIGVISDPLPHVTSQLQAYGCCAMRRLDFKRLNAPPTTIKGGSFGGGADLFAMTRGWWDAHKKTLPDMFLGTEGFDFVLAVAMYESGHNVRSCPPILFHERHGSFWKKDKATLLHSPAQNHNRTVCAAWAKLNGYGYMLNTKSGFLFKEMKSLRPVKKAQYDLGIVVLGRYGDIINTLPIAYSYAMHGQKIAWAVLPEYKDIFDGISYVTPIVFNGRLDQVPAATRQIKQLCKNVQSWQMFGNPAVGKRRTHSFAMEMWRMAGAMQQWEALPLVFDRRDAAREEALRKQVLSNKKFPLLFSGTGTSSPFSDASECLQAVREIAAKYDTPVIDISHVRAERIYDMLGVFERSCGLVVIDSAYLHLTYACRTPTFALTSEGPRKDRSLWYGSQPRCQWRAKASYSEWKNILPELERWFVEGIHLARVEQCVLC